MTLTLKEVDADGRTDVHITVQTVNLTLYRAMLKQARW